jgi:hypothetical protein
MYVSNILWFFVEFQQCKMRAFSFLAGLQKVHPANSIVNAEQASLYRVLALCNFKILSCLYTDILQI